MKQRLFALLMVLSLTVAPLYAQEWYRAPEEVESRWTSFENLRGAKGQGGMENQGAKGHAFDNIPAGESKTLLDVQGSGIVQRIWMTIDDRTPYMLRALRIDMYWDGADEPAVSAPLGDFFGMGLGQMTTFENVLFSSPEGRSFNTVIPMPFRTAAKIVVTNESEKDLVHLFYDVNYAINVSHDEDVLYFHAYWNRDLKTKLAEDFEVLPAIAGKGRFLGTNMSIITNEVYQDYWWGEGEVKVFLDGDTDHATLVGTGTEDYVGTGWGMGAYANQYQGSLVANPETRQWSIYRYHIPDPVYFHTDCRVTVQQIGGNFREKVQEMIDKEIPLIPITVDAGPNGFTKFLEADNPPDGKTVPLPEGWINFYRQDDWASIAYFYLDRPENDLPPLAPLDLRVAHHEE